MSEERTLFEQIEARRNDKEFMARLARTMAEDKEVLDRLAEGPADPSLASATAKLRAALSPTEDNDG